MPRFQDIGKWLMFQPTTSPCNKSTSLNSLINVAILVGILPHPIPNPRDGHTCTALARRAYAKELQLKETLCPALCKGCAFANIKRIYIYRERMRKRRNKTCKYIVWTPTTYWPGQEKVCVGMTRLIFLQRWTVQPNHLWSGLACNAPIHLKIFVTHRHSAINGCSIEATA